MYHLKKIKRPLVFVPMAADLFHHGHINILLRAKKYGSVIVGLMTDKGIASYKGVKPFINYKNRKKIIKQIKLVSKIIPLNGLIYSKIAKKHKFNYVVHGDDWKAGIQKKTRERVIKTIKKWGGKLIEPKYTKNISSSQIKTQISNLGITPQNRSST